jgi:hypothetical protein
MDSLANPKLDLLKKAAGNDPDEALRFLLRVDEWLTDVWQFTDHGPHSPTQFISLLARANTTLSLPFYVRNAPFLQLHVSQALMSRSLSELVIAVATLKLGFAEARKLRDELLATEQKSE